METEVNICGCTIVENEKPFSFKKIKNEGIIELYGKEFGSAWGNIADKEIIDNIIGALNKAYRLGFEACGNTLMPKLMIKQKELEENNGVK